MHRRDLDLSALHSFSRLFWSVHSRAVGWLLSLGGVYLDSEVDSSYILKLEIYEISHYQAKVHMPIALDNGFVLKHRIRGKAVVCVLSAYLVS